MSQACIQATCKSALEKNYEVILIADGHDSIIKPLRNVWNKKLQALGAKTLNTSDYLNLIN